MTFRESLNASVTLSNDTASASGDGGNIKELDLRLSLHGFVASLRIWVLAQAGADEFFAIVCAETPIQVELKLAKALYNVSPSPTPLTISGLVIARSIREVAAPDLSGSPVLYREYSIDFCDAARALWSTHHPSIVYTKTSVDSLIKEHTPSQITVRSQWSLGKRVRPIICLGLGMDQASFYDWLFWLADAEYGHIWYDYSAQNLVLDSTKPAIGSKQELIFGAITQTMSFQVQLAQPPRQAVNLLNSRDTATAKWSVDQPNAITGLRRDFLLHTPLDADAQTRQATEKNRHATGKFDVHVDCDAFPEMYLAPGGLLTIGGEFSNVLFVSGKTLRVLEVAIHGRAVDQTPEYDIENDTTEYDVSFALDLEADDDPRWRGHSYTAPRYPLRVEGKVVSSVGDTTDRAYTVFADADTGDTYKITFALWNCTIAIPMTPDFMPGHMYFPVYKDSRVFATLEFDSARIERFLDWGKDVTVPSASLGNHLLLGKNDTSETSIKHWYVDNSPELVIGRVHSGDLGTVTVKEGTLTLELTDTNGAAGFAATTSVEPQAQMAKADTQQKSDLAVSDLQEATSGAQTQLTTEVTQATTSLRQQAEQLATQVDTKSKTLDQALADVGTSIDTQAQQVEQVFTDARQELEDLLK